MEHIYTAYSKEIQGRTHYFVKKIMTLPELTGVADLVVGYGMHTDFGQACHIAGIDDPQLREGILRDIERAQRPQVASQPKKADPVTRLLADLGVAVMN